MDMKELYDYFNKRAGELAEYSDKLRESFRELDEQFTPLFEKAGIYFRGMALYSNDYETIYLAIGKDKNNAWGFLAQGDFNSRFIFNESRKTIKKVVNNLMPFLNDYKDQLDKTTEEYKQASEMVEAMNIAIKELKKEV